jgi:hypothetical protein
MEVKMGIVLHEDCEQPVRHHELHLRAVWKHEAGTEVRAFIPADRIDPELEHLNGRAVVNLCAGGFALHLQPTVPELRALATLFTVLADQMACAAASRAADRQDEEVPA